MKSLNFVCLGNICRSPLAEAVMRKKIEGKGRGDQYFLDSSGVGDWHVGRPSDPRMIKLGRSKGLKMDHLAKKLAKEDGEIFDYFFIMDEHVYHATLDLLGEEFRHKVIMFREFDTIGDSREVNDPYYGGTRGFENAYETIDRNCQILFDKLESGEL